MRIGNLSTDAISNYFERPHATPLFNAEYLWNGTRYEHVLQRNIGTYAVLKSVISNDLEWLCEIFNDTNHRAASLRQLSLLYTPGSKPTFSTNPSDLNYTSLPIWLPSWSWDWTGLVTLISLFFFQALHFLFTPCGRCVRLSWLSFSFLLHAK